MSSETRVCMFQKRFKIVKLLAKAKELTLLFSIKVGGWVNGEEESQAASRNCLFPSWVEALLRNFLIQISNSIRWHYSSTSHFIRIQGFRRMDVDCRTFHLKSSINVFSVGKCFNTCCFLLFFIFYEHVSKINLICSILDIEC